MESPFEEEHKMGMEFYSTEFIGIGGKIKVWPEDFIVEEILLDGTVLHRRPFNNSEFPDVLEGRGSYIHFTLQKRKLTTFDAANILSRSLKVPQIYISYAGLKDKQAITVQRMSIKDVSLEQFRKFRHNDIIVWDLQRERRPIFPGSLYGNKFTILIKKLERTDFTIAELESEFLNRPLYNFFGIQRFGLTRPSSHIVGKYLITGNFYEAARHFVGGFSPYEQEDIIAFRCRLFENFEVSEEILQSIPKSLNYERIVLRHLLKYPEDYLGAMLRLPFRLVKILVHSYQSYLFNKLLSYRIQSGKKINQVYPGEFIATPEPSGFGYEEWLLVTDDNIELAQAKIDSGHQIIVYPIPGYSTKLPPGFLREAILKILEDEHIKLRKFRNDKIDALDSPGSLRPLSFIPQNLKIKIVDGELLLEFILKRGCYATVFLREIMKNHPYNRA